ncbi:macro domain-containing protein [Caldifermentibacillus hisashii]|uniref:Macro domain-containing protein n=1 Tax=Caldifermentibacillus hisashii TaxID=996558 RepID=A0ABU9K322_9BACI
MIKIVTGSILNARENIIGHQVNCQGVMGAGLALQIKKKYPNVYESYVKLVNQTKEKYKQGCLQTDSLLSACQFVDTHDGKTIANIFGQYGYGRGKTQTDYEALRKGLYSIKEVVTNPYSLLYQKTVALPYGIGCGLAGGKWNIVYNIIDEVFEDYEVTLYRLAR